MQEHAGNIVFIEDDPHIRKLVRSALEQEGFIVHEAKSAREGVTEAGTRKPDLIILDLGLPDGDGKQVISEIRNWSSVPIVILSARTQESEKVEALDAGADDYLVKPFGMPELLARMRAQLRRHARASGAGQSSGRYRLGEVVVDLPARSVSRNGEALPIAKLLQGGGHPNACGASLPKTIQRIPDAVEYLKKTLNPKPGGDGLANLGDLLDA